MRVSDVARPNSRTRRSLSAVCMTCAEPGPEVAGVRGPTIVGARSLASLLYDRERPRKRAESTATVNGAGKVGQKEANKP